MSLFLQHLSLALGGLCAAFNLYVLACLITVGHFDPVRPVFYLFILLFFGVFVCFFPAVRRLNEKVEAVSEQQSALAPTATLIREGGPLWPFVALWVYGFVSATLHSHWSAFPEKNGWLLLSTVCIAFYYLSWAIHRADVRIESAA
jgi:hypothetical protein